MSVETDDSFAPTRLIESVLDHVVVTKSFISSGGLHNLKWDVISFFNSHQIAQSGNELVTDMLVQIVPIEKRQRDIWCVNSLSMDCSCRDTPLLYL